MHEVHVYEGVVLGRRAVREADLLVDVLTPAGLLRAMARSARAERSKLRYSLQPLTRGRYSLVRGRHEWRLTGVVDASRAYQNAAPPAQAAMARIARLLLRLVAGTEPSPELFSTVSEGFDALAKEAGLGGAGAEAAGLQAKDKGWPSGLEALESAGKPPESSLEVILVLRILSRLGYLPHTEALAPFVEGEFSVELSAKALEARALLVRTINESLKATGL